MAWSVEETDCRTTGAVRGQLVRCDSIAFTSVEVQNLHAKAGTFDDPVDQCLKTNFINFRLQRVYLRGAILLQR
jgi:hypothetical protein